MTDGELEALITEMRAKLPADAYERVQHFLLLGVELLDAGNPRQARFVFGQIIADMTNLPPSERRDQAQSIAWYNIAIAAGGCGNVDEEIGIYTHPVERFGEARDPDVRYTLAMSMYNKAAKLV